MIVGVHGKYNEEEIIKALKMIKDICYRQEDCKNCPFYSEDYSDCNFNIYEPLNWSFKESETWRAFAED